MDTATKFMLLAVSVCLCALIMSIIIYVWRTGDYKMSELFKRFSTTITSINEPKFSKYAGRYIDGKTVRATMEDFGGDYFFRIRTKNDPLTFAVYEKPVKHLLNDGSGKFYNYTESDSLFYVNENALFMTTVYRNSGGTVIGAMFEEKGSGSMSAQISQLYQLSDLLQAQNKYLENVKTEKDDFSDIKIDQAIESTNKVISDIESQITELLTEQSTDNVNKELSDKFAQSKQNNTDLSSKLEKAWSDYEDAFQKETGKVSKGHYSIEKNSDKNDVNDLQYWIALFSGQAENKQNTE